MKIGQIVQMDGSSWKIIQINGNNITLHNGLHSVTVDKNLID